MLRWASTCTQANSLGHSGDLDSEHTHGFPWGHSLQAELAAGELHGQFDLNLSQTIRTRVINRQTTEGVCAPFFSAGFSLAGGLHENNWGKHAECNKGGRKIAVWLTHPVHWNDSPLPVFSLEGLRVQLSGGNKYKIKCEHLNERKKKWFPTRSPCNRFFFFYLRVWFFLSETKRKAILWPSFSPI